MAVKSLDEVIAEGRLRQVLDLKLTKALAHALRGHIVVVLNERVVSPNEIAKELGMDVAYVSYHFRVLRDDYGLIEPGALLPRRLRSRDTGDPVGPGAGRRASPGRRWLNSQSVLIRLYRHTSNHEGGSGMASRSMKEVIESGELKRFMDPRIVTAVGHRVREHSLAKFNEGITSATEIGREIDLDVSAFYHHIELLEELGCIEEVDTRQRRGGKEHFFRAKSTIFFDNKHWLLVPESVQDDMSSSMLRSLFGEAATAAKSGTLNSSDGEHISWTPGRFDRQARSEAAALLDETLDRLTGILDRSAERLAENNERGTAATIGLLGFDTEKADSGQSVRAS